jgi:hypothetical protein
LSSLPLCLSLLLTTRNSTLSSLPYSLSPALTTKNLALRQVDLVAASNDPELYTSKPIDQPTYPGGNLNPLFLHIILLYTPT